MLEPLLLAMLVTWAGNLPGHEYGLFIQRCITERPKQLFTQLFCSTVLSYHPAQMTSGLNSKWDFILENLST